MAPNLGKQRRVVELGLLCVLFDVAFAKGSVNVTMFSDLADKGSMPCDSKVVLMCKIQPNSITMTWTIDGTRVADCLYEKCETYTTGVANYRFSFDTSKRIFNITLDPVTFTDNGKTFKCDDGSDFAKLSAVVKVIPKNSATTITSTKGSPFTEMKATSGCLYPSTSVTFEWYYFKEGHEPAVYKENKPTTSMDEKDCSNGYCGGKGVVKVTSTLTIKEDDDGEEYYFQVLVTHPHKTDIIVTTNSPFKLKGKDYVDKSTVTPSQVLSRSEKANTNKRIILMSFLLPLYLTSY